MTTKQELRNDTLHSAIVAMMADVREVNEANGWFEDDRRFAEGIALIHSEASEALEAFRDYHDVKGHISINPGDGFDSTVEDSDYHGYKPLGVPSEMADVLIRLLDECDRQGIDLYAEFRAKLEYNKTRGFHHGGKSL